MVAIRIENWFQGPTGSGQGGWTAHRLRAAAGEPVTVAIKRPIPLERDLAIVELDRAWHLVDPDAPDQPIMIATPWTPDVPETAPVSIADAAIAGQSFPLFDDHPVPHCFSCGLGDNAMQVHSGPLADGRWATDWTVPHWAASPGPGTEGAEEAAVDEGVLWAAIDCAQAWYAGIAGGRRNSVTVQLAVDLRLPLEPQATYALVAWAGDYYDGWDGRKRGTCGAVFDDAGRCVAVSRSFWVAIDEVAGA